MHQQYVIIKSQTIGTWCDANQRFYSTLTVIYFTLGDFIDYCMELFVFAVAFLILLYIFVQFSWHFPQTTP